jgi:hypothetical protein
MKRLPTLKLFLTAGFCLVFLSGGFLSGAALQASGDNKKHLAIIVNVANPVQSLSVVELQRIFRAEQNHWPDGHRITIVLLEPGQPERDMALREIYQMSERDLTRYFVQATFTGEALSAPKTLATASGLRKFVFNVPGAIGCVSADEVDATVKVVRLNGHLPGEKGYPLRLDAIETW